MKLFIHGYNTRVCMDINNYLFSFFLMCMSYLMHGFDHSFLPVGQFDPVYFSLFPSLHFGLEKQGLQSAHQLALMHPARTILVLLQQDIQPNVVQTVVQWSQQRLVSFFFRLCCFFSFRWVFSFVANRSCGVIHDTHSDKFEIDADTPSSLLLSFLSLFSSISVNIGSNRFGSTGTAGAETVDIGSPSSIIAHTTCPCPGDDKGRVPARQGNNALAFKLR